MFAKQRVESICRRLKLYTFVDSLFHNKIYLLFCGWRPVSIVWCDTSAVVSDVWWEQGNHATWRDEVQLIYICVCVFASRYLDHLLARGRDKATARNSPRFSLRPMPHNNLQKYPPCSVGYSGPLWRASSQPSALSPFPGSNFFLPWTLKLVGGLPKKIS